jgi:hypothetical protein
MTLRLVEKPVPRCGVAGCREPATHVLWHDRLLDNGDTFTAWWGEFCRQHGEQFPLNTDEE